MTGIPGILKKSGDQVIHDLIKSGHGVDLDFNQITIEKVNTITYLDRQAVFTIKAREMGADGSRPIYIYQTSVLYERFTADNYFSRHPYYIELAAPYTVARVVAALNTQTELYWDLDDFKDAATATLAVSSAGVTTLPGSQYSKRLFLEIANSRLTVIITPPGRVSLPRVMPPAAIQPPDEFFKYTDPRTNLALRLPDANGVVVGGILKLISEDHVVAADENVDWMTQVYGYADGYNVKWVSSAAPADYNLCGAKVLWNGPIQPDHPKPYNTRLDRVLIFELSEELCSNYYGKGIIYYNLSRDGEP